MARFIKHWTACRHLTVLSCCFSEGSTPSAHEIEARYAALFGKTQELPLAVLVAIPVAFLIILTAVFIRALEKAKQKHGAGLVKKTDMNGNVVVMSKSCSDKESTNQVTKLDYLNLLCWIINNRKKTLVTHWSNFYYPNSFAKIEESKEFGWAEARGNRKIWKTEVRITELKRFSVNSHQ